VNLIVPLMVEAVYWVAGSPSYSEVTTIFAWDCVIDSQLLTWWRVCRVKWV
jgi:hypothetical protein